MMKKILGELAGAIITMALLVAGFAFGMKVGEVSQEDICRACMHHENIDDTKLLTWTISEDENGIINFTVMDGLKAENYWVDGSLWAKMRTAIYKML